MPRKSRKIKRGKKVKATSKKLAKLDKLLSQLEHRVYIVERRKSRKESDALFDFLEHEERPIIERNAYVPIQAKESIHIKEKVKKAAKRHPSNFGAYTNPVTATRLIVEDILHLHGLSNSVKVKLAKSRVTKITELHHITIYGWQKNPDLAREIITHIKSKVKHPVRIDLLVKSVK